MKKKNQSFFLSENLQFLEGKFSIYLNRRVFVMLTLSDLTGTLLSALIQKSLNTGEYISEQ